MSLEMLPIEAAHLMAAASAEAKLDDYGDPGFIEPLEHFLHAAVSEANLGAMGLIGLRMDVMRLLINRLRMHDDLKRHPEIREEDVSDPIVITGLPRTGTTKLQRMLAQDSRFQSLAVWRALSPAPLPGSTPGCPDPRIDLARGMTDQLAQMFPGFLAAHPMQPTEAEEEVLLLQMSFETPGTAWFYRIPSYYHWVQERPQTRPYQELRTTLQYLQWQDGGRRGRQWVLKSPIHLGALNLVADTFPRASIVHCHRDPTVAIPSLCGLIEFIMQSRGNEQVDLIELGQYFNTSCAELWKTNLEQRAHLGATIKILDVAYDEIKNDARAVIQEIYRAHGMAPESCPIDKMVRWEEQNPQDLFGKHQYSLERYGLTTESVHQSYRVYMEHFADMGK